MIKTILQNYSSFPGINDLKDLIREFENDKSKNLADLNINLIKFVCKKILIKTQMIRSSDFQIDKKRTDKIIDLLKLTNSTSYLSAVGAKDYLIKDNFKKKLKLIYFIMTLKVRITIIYLLSYTIKIYLLLMSLPIWAGKKLPSML